jgi:uncharacterized damage-inducible protein DinB
MIGRATIQELFCFDDWAWHRLLAALAPLADAQLDQQFEIGPGSVRATVRHLYGAQRNWLARWRGSDQPSIPAAGELSTPAEFDHAHRALVRERSADVGRLDFSQTCAYTNPQGRVFTFALGDVLLHVCNHGIHHRAQAVNMLRRLGQPPLTPPLDYILMRLNDPATPALDVATIDAYYAYCDWAYRRLHDAAQDLPDGQLDASWPLGVGSLRATLLHIAQAEQWWLDNWTRGPEHWFPSFDERISIAEIRRRFDHTAGQRNQMLQGLTEADLGCTVTATARPGVQRSFPLGVTMLQLCCHGTHHRAQALNMLRQVGAALPELDYLHMIAEQTEAKRP